MGSSALQSARRQTLGGPRFNRQSANFLDNHIAADLTRDTLRHEGPSGINIAILSDYFDSEAYVVNESNDPSSHHIQAGAI
ncbi:MAG: hypothetical protein M2R46_05614 [Verrucomicrobia subdivision 3 bacterium]|nr:hypothetical protein [Limisphaerales bacterium]